MTGPETGSSEALVLSEGEGLPLIARGSRMLFKAVADTTGGAFSLMERSLPAGGRPPPPHRHPDCTEAFYLLDGALDFLLGDQRTTVRTGAFVLVPGGVTHTFVNPGKAPARVLILHSPALDGYFRELHELWLAPVPPTVAQEQELMSRHGLQPVPEAHHHLNDR